MRSSSPRMCALFCLFCVGLWYAQKKQQQKATEAKEERFSKGDKKLSKKERRALKVGHSRVRNCVCVFSLVPKVLAFVYSY